MAVQPATKITELVERATVLLHQKVRDEVAIRRLEQDAKRLVNADPVASHVLQGMLATLKQEPAAMHEHFQVALKLAPGNAWVASNYATALYTLSFFSEARESAQRAYEQRRGDLAALDRLIGFCSVSCRFDLAMHWLEERAKLAPKEPHPLERVLHALHAHVASRRLAHEDLEAYSNLAVSIAHTDGVYEFLPEIELAEDDDVWIGEILRVPLPVADVVRLNDALADRMAESELSVKLAGEMSCVFLPLAANGR